MSNPIYPGAIWNPGAAAGYAKGHNSVQCCKCHYTVGRDSTGIGLNGYFQFLISRNGTVQQFAEVDALCWDSGEHNGTGPGIEVEYLDEDEIFTAEARQACGALVHWLSTEWGLPLVYHDGDHDTPVSAYQGFISHRSLIQAEQHQDYWPQTDWAQMVSPTPTLEGAPDMYVMRCAETSQDLIVTEFRVAGYPINSVTGPVVVVTASRAEVDAEIKARADLAAKLVVAGGAGGSAGTLKLQVVP